MFYLGDKEMKRDALWQNGSNKSQIRFSINKKILMLAAAIVLPFFIVVVVLLVSMIQYSRVYEAEGYHHGDREPRVAGDPFTEYRHPGKESG